MSTDSPTELNESLEVSVSTRGMLAGIAIDMTGLSNALLKQLGGVSGWSSKYKDLFDRAIAAGNYRVAADLLKMVPDTMERASKAGSRAIEDLTDAELEQAAVGILVRAMKSDHSLAAALAKDATVIEVAKENSNADGPSVSDGDVEDQCGDESPQRGSTEGLRPDRETEAVPSVEIT
jgi:hypothetical protein